MTEDVCVAASIALTKSISVRLTRSATLFYCGVYAVVELTVVPCCPFSCSHVFMRNIASYLRQWSAKVSLYFSYSIEKVFGRL